MADDDLPQPPVYVPPTPPTPPTPPATETRNVLDISSNVIGTLTLLAGLSEAIWTLALAFYSTVGGNITGKSKEYSTSVSTNTSSSNYTALNSMISDSLDADTYLVTFTGNISTTAPLLTSPGFYISLFLNGVQILTSEVSDVSSAISLFSISPITMTINALVTVPSGQKIDVRWKTNGVGNTITCTNRVLDIVRMK